VTRVPRGDSRRIGAFRGRQSAEERRSRLEVLAAARSQAESVVLDGREYRVLRLEDRYPEGGPVGGKSLRDDEVDRLDHAE